MNETTIEMTDKARQARAAYQRAWRKKNQDKVRQYKTNYWEKKAKELENN